MRQRLAIPVGITATGQFYPERIVTNTDLAKVIDTSDEWILTRTGIRARRWVEPGVASSDLGAKALEMALERRGIGPGDLDAIVVATATPDMFFPCTAAIIQQKVGANNAYGFDINAACSGFLFALTTGASLISGSGMKRVAVIGSDVMTSVIDKSDRNTAVLFGDGSGAVILEQVEDGYGILDFEHKMDGSGASLLCMPGGGSLHPATTESVIAKMHFVRQDGKEVYRRAVQDMTEVSRAILDRNNITTNELSLFIPHQANLRIIDAVAKRLCLSTDRIAINIRDFANTTSATIPTALHSSLELGKIKRNDLVVFTAFGAGFTWGSVLIRWT